MLTCNNRSTSALASTQSRPPSDPVQSRPRPYPCILRAFYSKVAMTPLSLLPCNCAPSHDPAHTNLSFAHSTPQWLSRLYPCCGHHPLISVAPPRNSRSTSALPSAQSYFNPCPSSHALVLRAFYPAVDVTPLPSCLSSCYSYHPLSSVAPPRNNRCTSPPDVALGPTIGLLVDVFVAVFIWVDSGVGHDVALTLQFVLWIEADFVLD
jgi:hypothetical protein